MTLQNVTVVDIDGRFADATIEKSLNDDELLDVGEIWTYTYFHIATQSDVDSGRLHNEVLVTAVPPSGEETSTGSTKDVPTNRNPNFTIEKTADKDELILGDNITYTVVVQNTGNVTLNTITLQDTLVSDLSTITPVNLKQLKRLYNNNVLDVNEKWTYQYTYTVARRCQRW